MHASTTCASQNSLQILKSKDLKNSFDRYIYNASSETVKIEHGTKHMSKNILAKS